MRVILDVNILISFLLLPPGQAGTIATIVERALRRTYRLLLPPELLPSLLRNVSTAPYLTDRIGAENARAFAETLIMAAEVLPPLASPPAPICRDPSDDYLLAHAAAGRVDCQVSGDKDLLVLAETGLPFSIVTPGEVLAVLDLAGLG